MKKFMKDVFEAILIVTAFIAVFTCIEVVNVEEKGTKKISVATPTEGCEHDILESVGVRTTTTSPYGVISIIEDRYIDGTWARSGVLFGHIMFDAYTGAVRWI